MVPSKISRDRRFELGRPTRADRSKTKPLPHGGDTAAILGLQTKAGNAAVQSLLAETPGNVSGPALQRAAASAPPAGKSLTEIMPRGVDPTSASLSFVLKGGLQLSGGTRPVSTAGPTHVVLSMEQTQLVAKFNPALVIDVEGNNVTFARLEYDFTRPASTGNPDVKTGGGMYIPFVGHTATLAKDEIRSTFIRALPASMKSGTYNPATDPNGGHTLRYIATALNSGPTTSGSTGLGAKDASQVRASATITATAPLMVEKAAGAVVLPSGATATLRVNFAGTAADIMNPATLKIDSVHLSTNSLTLQKDGADVAVITSLQMDYGGKVRVDGWRALGEAQEVQGLESGARLILFLLELTRGSSRDRLAVREGGQGDLFEPSVTTELIRLQLETTIQAAVSGWIKQNPGAVPIPGVDLVKALGL